MPESTVVRELVTFLGFDIDDKALAEFDKKVNSIRKNLKRMAITGGIVAGVLTGIVVKTAQLGTNLVNTSKRIGVGVEALQKWRFAFEQAGVGAQTFDMSVQRVGRRLAEAAKGTGEAQNAVVELGLQLTDTNGELRDLDILLAEALDSLVGFANSSDRSRLAQKLFDSEGVALKQILSENNEELKESKKLFEEVGAVMSEETAKAAQGLTNEWGVLKATLLGFVITVGKELLPIVTDLLTALRKWLVTNRAAILTVTGLGLAILSMTSVMFGAIAATTLWNLKLLILNTTVGALLVKMLIIPLAISAALVALGILAQDFVIGIGQSGDSVTGRILNAVAALGERIKKGALGYVNAVWNRLKEVWTWIINLPDLLNTEINAMVDRQFGRLIALKNSIFGDEQGTPLPSRPSDPMFGAFDAAFSGQGAASMRPPSAGPKISITINALPGQDAVAIGSDVNRRLTGVGITGGLTGLGK